MRNPFKKRPEKENIQSLDDPETVEPLDSEEKDSEEDTEDTKTIENLDISGFWNRKLDDEEKYLSDGGLMTVTFVTTGKGPKRKTIIDLIAKMEQSIIDLRLSMVTTQNSYSVFRKTTKEFKMWRRRLGLRQYARFLIGLRHSCINEQDLGFHQPSFSQWDFDLENVDNEYARQLKAYHDKRKEIEIGEGWDKGLEK